MAEQGDSPAADPSPAPTPAGEEAVPAPSVEAVPQFDPSRMIGIIKRKALIKELAAMYHAECLSCCRELLDLQKEWEQDSSARRALEQPRRETSRSSKRSKKNY